MPIDIAGGEDKTSDLLNNTLYPLKMESNTPLKDGLNRIGQYFDTTTSAGGLGSSPLLPGTGECQSNYAIAITDGYYTDAAGSVTVGNTDGDGSSDYDGGEFADTYSDTMADVAMKYYEKDLMPPEENDSVEISDSDKATHQHMVTYTVAFGVEGTLPPGNYPSCQGPYPSGCPDWPEPSTSDTDKKKIDDGWHAAVNGRGKYVSAKSAQELINALKALEKNIGDRKGSGASASANGPQLNDGSVLYQPWYTTAGWRGEMRAYKLTPTGGIGESAWTKQPHEWLDNEMSWDERKIFTYNGTNGISFDFDSLSSEYKKLIYDDFDESSSETAGEVKKRIEFLKGNRDEEGNYRARSSILGDIIHSSPMSIDGVLYVGANDGMLHAFDARLDSPESGKELFAYIPNLVFGKLKHLTSPYYNLGHHYFVDLGPYAMTLDPEAESPTTLLVGGLGKGGKGYYCLDISDTDGLFEEIANVGNFASQHVKWEYPNATCTDKCGNDRCTDTDDCGDCDGDYPYDTRGYPYSCDPDMGFSFSKAYIANTNADKGVVIFGNGYDSENANAVLYILDALTGKMIKKIDTGVGDPNLEGQCNGLATPLLMDDGFIDGTGERKGALDGKVDYVYAGDLLGNMWKFDLTGSNSDLWGLAYGTEPLFQATDPDGNPQPITIKPDVMKHCHHEGYIVLFGTGRYLTNDDIGDKQTQSVYGVWDWADQWIKDGASKAQVAEKSLKNRQNLYSGSTLLEQTFTFSNDGNYRALSNNEIKSEDWYTPLSDTDEGEGHIGWFFDLPDEGERVFSEVLIIAGKALVISSVPSAGGSVCTAGSEYSFLNTLDVCSGTPPSTPLLTGLPSIDTVGSDGTTSTVSSTSKKTGSMFNPPVVIDAGDGTSKMYFTTEGPVEGDDGIVVEESTGTTEGVIYWRERDL